jgi:hypothetical protein
LGQRALNPLMLTTEAEMILRTYDTVAVRPEIEPGGRGISSGEVVRGAALPARAVTQLSETERFGRQGREKYKHGEVAETRRHIAARRQLIPAESAAAEHPLPLAGDGVERELVAQGKRWRGL